VLISVFVLVSVCRPLVLCERGGITVAIGEKIVEGEEEEKEGEVEEVEEESSRGEESSCLSNFFFGFFFFRGLCREVEGRPSFVSALTIS